MRRNLFNLLTAALLSIAVVGISCSGMRSRVSKPRSPDEIRKEITVLIAKRQADQEWMNPGGCPSAAATTSALPPSVAVSTCEHDPVHCLSKCDEGNGAFCYSLALVIQRHDTIENAVANILFRKACRYGIASGCTNAASPLSDSDDPETLACAARTFEAVCANGDPWGCAMDGMMKMRGLGGQPDHEGARRSIDRTCELAAAMEFPEPCERAKELKTMLEKESGKQQ